MHVVFYSGYINSICNKATILHYTKEKVEKTPIVLPSIVEQKSIVNYLDSKCSEIDALLQNYEDQITTLEEYKKSLIYEYVTGKKEVRQRKISQPEDMPAKGGRPWYRKTSEASFSQGAGRFPAGVWGSAPYNLRISYSPQYFHGGRRLI